MNMIIVPLKWKLRLPLDYLGFLMLLNQKGKNHVALLVRVIDPNH